MADGKWIEDLYPEMPLADAARYVLRVRLQVVRDTLPPAVHHADRDPEHVHQLRVATRRADAALRIFRANLSEKKYKTARNRLRRIRRAAGVARDWDVFLINLLNRRTQRPPAESAGLDFLVGFVVGQRMAAQPELEAIGEENDQHAFEAFLANTVEAVDSSDDQATLLDLARPLLSNLLHRLDETVNQNLSDYTHLHQVRIAGKRLRYAMEVFAGCFQPAFREAIYPHVEEVQEILGRANDSHVAASRLLALRNRLKQTAPEEWKRVRAGVEGLLHYHNRRLPQERRRFLAWWERWTKNGVTNLKQLLQAEERL